MACAVVSVMALQLFVAVVPAPAAVLTSADFTFGFGATLAPPNLNAWTTTETAGGNSSTTQGNFTFSPTVSGLPFTSNGPVFTGGVLADGTFGDVSAALEAIANFGMTLNASYGGAAPGDAAIIPNYRLLVEVTNLSLWAADYPGTQVGQAELIETTSGHAQQSATTILNITSAVGSAASYKQLIWDPGDYEVPLAGLNDAVVRTFSVLTYSGFNDYRYADGFEIQGRVSLVYDVAPVPEPSAFILACLGLAGTAGYVRRKRK